MWKVKVLVAQLCLTLSDLMNYRLSGSSVHGISQERILEWVSIPFSRGSSWPRDRTQVSWIGRWILYCWATRKPYNLTYLSLNILESFCTSMSFFMLFSLLGSLLHPLQSPTYHSGLRAMSYQHFINLTGVGNGTPLQYSCLENPMDGGAWWAAVHGVATSWTQLRDFTFTFCFYALEEEMATHSSILAWRIPRTGKPGGLPSMGSHRVGHWNDLAAAAAAAVA